MIERNVFPQTLKSLFLLFAIAAAGYFIGYKIVHIPAQLELVIIFALALFYPVLRYPMLGVYLLFMVLPFIPFVRRLYYLQYTRPGADPLIVVGDIITAVMITGLFFEFREHKDDNKGVNKISLIVLIYLSYLVLRTFVLNIMPASEAILRFRLYGPAVLLFFIGILFASNHKLLKSLWSITIVIGVIGALYGLKQLYYGYSEAERLWFSSISFTTLFIGGIARPFSLFQSPASFADYMQIATIGVVVLINWNKSSKFKYWYYFLLPLFFYGTLITSVRSNWIGLMVTFLLWSTVVHFKGTRNRIIIIILIGTLFALMQVFESYMQTGIGPAKLFSLSTGKTNNQFLNMLVTERASALSNPFEEHSLLSRISLWRYLLDLSRIPEMAAFGRGVGALNADSLYITYLAELGYPGMIFIIWLLAFFILKSFSLLDKAPVSSAAYAIARGAIIMNIVFCILNITGTHIHSFPGDAYFWFWNGIVIKMESLYKSGDHHVQNTDYN
jgi:hypothetical protein